MTDFVPAERPRLSFGDLMKLIRPLGLDPDEDPVFVVGIRGYYRRSMGDPRRNDRGIYDDAIFLVSKVFFGTYNGNTDPSKVRRGRGRGDGKGMATLNPGPWRVHRFGRHRDKYLALCQKNGSVKVTRDGVVEDYGDEGHFGINIHNGGWRTTSSLGCQRVHPSQWPGFIASAQDQAKRYHGERWDKVTIPYALLEGA